MSRNAVYYGVDLLLCIFEVFGLWYLLKEKPRRKQRERYIVVPYLLHYCFVWLFSEMNMNLYLKLSLITVIAVFLLYLFYEMPIFSLFQEVFIYTIILVAVEVVVVPIWDIFDKGTYVINIGKQIILIPQLNILVRMAAFCVIIIVERLRRSRDQEYKWRDIKKHLISLVTPFIVLIFINIYVDRLDDEVVIVTAVICSILILLSFVYSSQLMETAIRRERREVAEKMRLQELEIKNKFYQDKLRDAEINKKVYHDLKNHVLLLEALAKTEETERILEDLKSSIAKYNYYDSGNEFLDIILKDKTDIAEEKGIGIEMRFDSCNLDFLQPLDISTIFGNLFDNAIEACARCEEKYIRLKVKNVNEFLVVSMVNSMAEGTDWKRTSKADRWYHGFGIKNVQGVVTKYQGECDISTDEREFRFRILIPINSVSVL